MKASKMIINTIKEVPQEAKINSHILLLRSGMIRNIVSGVYNYLPLGVRTLKKVEDIVRDEMDKAGCLEVLSSAIQPKEIWEKSGRWSKYGDELISFKDRNEREFCLGPTHEEAFTTLAKDIIKSPKNLPLNIYQIQSKYRDEIRPRYGLIRARDFLMKDAYSFDLDEQGLNSSYELMSETYSKIFDRLKIKWKKVLADSGDIGGDMSHQFMAISDVGESVIVFCTKCGYAADVEKAKAIETYFNVDEEEKDVEEIKVGEIKSILDLSSMLSVDVRRLIKTKIYYDRSNDRVVLAAVRADREINKVKFSNVIGSTKSNVFELEDVSVLNEKFNINYIGLIQNYDVDVYVDSEVPLIKNTIMGANKDGFFYKNVNFSRDYDATVADIRSAVKGDQCPGCFESLKSEKGIEVGQIFKLQTKYSLPFNCSFQNENGVSSFMQMGCYGIGITRTLQSIVEQNNDDRGIKWPLNVAPYHCVVLSASNNDENQNKLAKRAYTKMLDLGIETILDDRRANMGYKLKDWELIGIPYIIICGKNTVDGVVELKNRLTNDNKNMVIDDAILEIENEIKLYNT